MTGFIKMVGALALLLGLVVTGVVGVLALAAGFGVTLDVGSVFSAGGLVFIVGFALIVVRLITKRGRGVRTGLRNGFTKPSSGFFSFGPASDQDKGLKLNPDLRVTIRNSNFDD